MKSVAVNGSSRGSKGVTHRLLNAFGKGLRDAGGDVTSFNLNEMTVNHCKSCFYCMHKNPGVCGISDDMDAVYGQLKSSDAFIIGTPLYTDTMTSRMKALFDRCICSMRPFIHEDDNGRFRHSFSWKMPGRFILISTCGFPERENFESLSKTVRAQAYNFGSLLAAEMLIPGAIAFQTDVSLLKNHLELMQRAGHAFGSGGVIPPDLLEAINAPVLSREEYVHRYGKYERWCMDSLKIT